MSSAYRELTVSEKIDIHCFLLEHTVNGRLQHGAVSKAVQQFKCHRSTIWKVRKADCQAPVGTPISIALQSYTSARGRKKTSPEKLENAIAPVHMNRRKTYRSLSKASSNHQTHWSLTFWILVISILYNLFNKKNVLSISIHLLLQLKPHTRKLQAQACLTTL